MSPLICWWLVSRKGSLASTPTRQCSRGCGGLGGGVHDTVMGVAFSFTPGPLSRGPCQRRAPPLLVPPLRPQPLGTPRPALRLLGALPGGSGKAGWVFLVPAEAPGSWNDGTVLFFPNIVPTPHRLCWHWCQGHPASVFTGCRKAWQAVSSPTLQVRTPLPSM